jgi:hypothetical protein
MIENIFLYFLAFDMGQKFLVNENLVTKSIKYYFFFFFLKTSLATKKIIYQNPEPDPVSRVAKMTYVRPKTLLQRRQNNTKKKQQQQQQQTQQQLNKQ